MNKAFDTSTNESWTLLKTSQETLQLFNLNFKICIYKLGSFPEVLGKADKTLVGVPFYTS